MFSVRMEETAVGAAANSLNPSPFCFQSGSAEIQPSWDLWQINWCIALVTKNLSDINLQSQLRALLLMLSSLRITTCFGLYGPSSGEYNTSFFILNIVDKALATTTTTTTTTTTLATTCYLFGLIFVPEDESNMFLRIVSKLLQDCKLSRCC
jgi:hypothetical protein